MSDQNTMVINGTVNKITEVTTPFEATKIEYTTTNGKETSVLFGLKTPTANRQVLDNLTAGSLIKVTLVKNEKGFFNPTKLESLSVLPEKKTSTFTPSKGYDASGAIRGMLFQKAVDILRTKALIAQNSSGLTHENIVATVKELNKSRLELETLDVTAKPKVEKKEPPFEQHLI